MKRIIIVGPSGAGKSEFARKLQSKLGLPLYALDNIWWNKDKTHITREEFDEKLKVLLEEDEWIIDGDFSRTYETRIKACDTIFFLKYPLDVCLKGVESRIGKVRPDIPWVEEQFDPEFKEWIMNWYNNKLPILNELLETYKDQKNIIIFTSRIEAHDYLNNNFNKEG